jgi:hypothetical protein
VSLIGWAWGGGAMLLIAFLFMLTDFAGMWIDHRKLQASTYRSDQELLEYPAMVASQESDL